MVEPILDISKWQGDIDEEKFLSAGALGAIIRAGSIKKDGSSMYSDFQLFNNVAKFSGVIPIGYYWYFRAEYNPKMQAEYFVGLIEDFYNDIPPAIDVEINNGYLSHYEFQTSVYDFLDRVSTLMGITPMVYTRGEFWRTNTGSPLWAGDFPLWIALYNETMTHPWDGYPKYDPVSWDDYTFWQYSTDDPPNHRGAEFGCDCDSVDINRFNGTLDDFHIFTDWDIEPPPPPEEKHIILNKCTGLNFRKGPGTKFEKVGAFYCDNNTVFRVVEESGNWLKVEIDDYWINKYYTKEV